MTYKKLHGTVVYNYNSNEARTHASSMLSSTIRKTSNICVIPYAMYPPPNIQNTRKPTNLHMRLEHIGFVLKRIEPQGEQRVT